MFLGTHNVFSKGYKKLSKGYAHIFKRYTDILKRIHVNVSRDTQKFFQKDILKFSNYICRFFQDRRKCFHGYETFLKKIYKIFKGYL
jgi:hypothetical protein